MGIIIYLYVFVLNLRVVLFGTAEVFIRGGFLVCDANRLGFIVRWVRFLEF